MLTKQDLSHIKTILQTELKVELKPIKDKLIEHDKEFKKIHKQLIKNNKDHATMIEYFDNNDIKHRERFNRIESHLGLPILPTI